MGFPIPAPLGGFASYRFSPAFHMRKKGPAPEIPRPGLVGPSVVLSVFRFFRVSLERSGRRIVRAGEDRFGGDPRRAGDPFPAEKGVIPVLPRFFCCSRYHKSRIPARNEKEPHPRNPARKESGFPFRKTSASRNGPDVIRSYFSFQIGALFSLNAVIPSRESSSEQRRANWLLTSSMALLNSMSD